MDKNLIMTYGLSKEQIAGLTKEFPQELILDATGCFSDLVAIPVAAVIIDPNKLNADEKEIFNFVFENDYDTCISILGTMGSKRFIYVDENDYQNMENTIDAIKNRLAIPREYKEAKHRIDVVIADIMSLVKDITDFSFRSQIGYMNNTCIPYEMLTKLMKHISELRPKEKVPYRVELNSVLQAVMIAHGIISISDLEIDFDDSREWIEFLANSVKNHYNDTVRKNCFRV